MSKSKEYFKVCNEYILKYFNKNIILFRLFYIHAISELCKMKCFKTLNIENTCISLKVCELYFLTMLAKCTAAEIMK